MFKNINKKYLNNNYEFITNIIIVFLCLILAMKFPAGSVAQELTKNIFFLFVLPAAYIKFILKRNLADYGLNVKNKKTGAIMSLISLAVVLGISYAFFKYTSVANSYSLPAYVVNDFRFFLLYELIFINITLFVTEFFFRGFLLFIFAKKIGYWTIIIQSLITAIFLLTGKNEMGIIFYGLIISLIAGILVYKNKSFIYSYAIILVSSILIDAYLIRVIK